VIGDSFGALNTLFAGLALAGLVMNIHLQSAQLRKLERKEEDNEKQLGAQAEALRFTALLHYYNNEIDRLERLLREIRSSGESETTTKLWERHDELRAERDKIVGSLGG